MTQALTWAEFEALRAPRPRTNSAEAKLRALHPGVPTLWGTYRTLKTATDPGRRAKRLADRLGIRGMVYAVRATSDGRYELWAGIATDGAPLAEQPRTVADRMSDAPRPEREAVSEFDALDLSDDAADTVPFATQTPSIVGGAPRITGGTPPVPPLGRAQPSRAAIATARSRPLVEPTPPRGPHAGPHTPPKAATGVDGARAVCVRCDTPIVYVDKRWRTDRMPTVPGTPDVTDEGECWKPHCDGRVLARVGERLARCSKCGDLTER